MTKKLIGFAVLVSALSGCASQVTQPNTNLILGDPSGYVSNVVIEPKDSKEICDSGAFQVGFGYTYMSMWNSRLNALLEANPPPNISTYYREKIFNSSPGIRASLDPVPKERDGYTTYCQESSFQLGQMKGFESALNNLKTLEENEPK